MSDSDLRFLEAERPLPDAPDAAATARARADLLEHAALTSRPRPVPTLAVRRPRRLVSPVRLAAAALVAAAVIGAVMTFGGSSRTPASLQVDRAVAAPLVKLSTKVAHATPPPGDATLVVRHQTYPAARRRSTATTSTPTTASTTTAPTAPGCPRPSGRATSATGSWRASSPPRPPP